MGPAGEQRHSQQRQNQGGHIAAGRVGHREDDRRSEKQPSGNSGSERGRAAATRQPPHHDGAGQRRHQSQTPSQKIGSVHARSRDLRQGAEQQIKDGAVHGRHIRPFADVQKEGLPVRHSKRRGHHGSLGLGGVAGIEQTEQGGHQEDHPGSGHEPREDSSDGQSQNPISHACSLSRPASPEAPGRLPETKRAAPSNRPFRYSDCSPMRR